MEVKERNVPNRVPCGRRLAVGAEVVLRDDTLYCANCGDLLPPLSALSLIGERRFRLERGAICGGGSQLD